MIDYVGTPVVGYISGQSYLSVGSSGSYTAEPSIIGSGIQYRWIVSPSSGASSSPWNNTNSVTFYNEETYNVSCQIISPCGYGSAASMIVTVVRNGGGYFSLSPNPATDVVTVQLNEAAAPQTSQGLGKAAVWPSGVCEIQLWSATSMLRSYKTARRVFEIPVSELPAGIYFVRIIDKDGKIYTEKLIKK